MGTTRTLYHAIAGNPDTVSIEITQSYRDAVAHASLQARTLGGLDIGSDISITMGYSGDSAKRFTGTVKSITAANLPGLYTIVAHDVLWRAQEYWFVPSNPDSPWSRSNIAAETLIHDILAEASIDDYSADWVPGFTFATGVEPVEIKLVAAWEPIKWVCEITGGHVYADVDGTVHYDDIQPVPGAPSAAITTGEGKEIIFTDYTKSDENLRNRVVVYGAPGIMATADAVSPYLPAGFYKTAIISHNMIDTQTMAQDAADLNLTQLNRLTEGVRVDIEGNPNINCRDTVTVTETFTGVAGNWFVLACTHIMDTGGYKTRLTLTK